MNRHSNNRQLTKRLYLPVIFMTLLLMLSGCSTIQLGRDFDIQTFNSMVKQGKTTKAQVRGWLGSPKGTGVSLDKSGELSEEWLYFSGTGQMPTMDDAKIKILQVRFNQKGIVESYNWSDSK